MTYKMFIDDERYPPEGEWVVCRNKYQVGETVSNLGFPSYISFDHDLGLDEPTGYDIALYLIELDLDHAIMPTDFDYYVHSQNPVGKSNIEGLLQSYFNFMED